VPSDRHQRNLRATLTGLGLNLALGLAKLAGGILGHSDALIADAVESFADLVGSLIVWRALAVAAQPADPEHPYGHGKAEPLATAALATLLMLAAAGIGLHAVREFSATQTVPHPLTLAVLLGVVVVKETLFRWVLHESAATGSSSVRADAWHHRVDAITSLAAALGITAALLGGPRWAGADEVAAALAALIIAWNGWRLLHPALSELMDTTPPPEVLAEIRRSAESVPGVDCVQKCLVRRMGYQLLVDLHVHVDPLMTVDRSHTLAHAVKDTIRDRLPDVQDVLIHIEPSRSFRPPPSPATVDPAAATPP
jgi:cation diffusion facilitator family transporter